MNSSVYELNCFDLYHLRMLKPLITALYLNSLYYISTLESPNATFIKLSQFSHLFPIVTLIDIFRQDTDNCLKYYVSETGKGPYISLQKLKKD